MLRSIIFYLPIRPPPPPPPPPQDLTRTPGSVRTFPAQWLQPAKLMSRNILLETHQVKRRKKAFLLQPAVRGHFPFVHSVEYGVLLASECSFVNVIMTVTTSLQLLFIILPGTGQENSTAQPKVVKCPGSASYFHRLSVVL